MDTRVNRQAEEINTAGRVERGLGFELGAETDKKNRPNFKNVFDAYNWEDVSSELYTKTAADVLQALKADQRGLNDFMALISPAAAPYLEQMAQLAHQLTLPRFGKTIQMYAPLYLSNECQNICTYCGFSLDNKIRRKTLSAVELEAEVAVLKKSGFNQVLLVSGEANHTVNLDYFVRVVKQIRSRFASISIEVQPLQQPEYEVLHAEGVHAVLVYQETYHRDAYKLYHPKGKKANFDFRLDTPDRIGRAGLHKMGLGVLLGLEDWRVDSFFNALHLDYLRKTYWKTKYTVSFPRLRPAVGTVPPNFHMDDRDLLQLICAYRIWDCDLELSLSTREKEHFRDHAIPLGITSMSAGSKTNPGGYSVDPQSLEQFEISDERSAAEISKVILKAGYAPVWKDWDSSFHG